MDKIENLIDIPQHLVGIYFIETPEGNYVGQSINIRTRLLRHNSNGLKELDIDKVINKYKENNLIKYYIIEECDEEQLNEREVYWIEYYNTYYNGLNNTKGGQNATICRGPKFTKDEAVQIIELILNNKTIRFEEIAAQFNCSIRTLNKINTGLEPYNYSEYNYPLRTKDESRVLRAYIGEEKIKNILFDLRNTTISMTEIGKKYNLCRNTIADINTGKKEPIIGYDYPARITRFMK